MVGIKIVLAWKLVLVGKSLLKIRYKVFRTHYSVWAYRVGMKNPANLHSREIKFSDLKDDQFYWQGPPWLSKYKFEWSSEQADYWLLKASTSDACVKKASKMKPFAFSTTLSYNEFFENV